MCGRHSADGDWWMIFKTTKSGQKLAAAAMCGLAALTFVDGAALAQGASGTDAKPAASGSALPPVTVDAPKPERRAGSKPSARPARPLRSVASRAPAATQDTAPALPSARSAGEKANGPVNGYLATQSATATKTETPILTTPQSISVVTKDQIAAQGAQNVTEALRYTPGVTVESFGANAFFDAFKLRGFDAPRYLDGLRLPADNTTFAVPRIETYGLERIEVLRGPSSGLYGQTDPGGLLNMVSKR